MDNSPTLNKKHIVLIILGLTFLMVTVFFFTHSIVIIKGTGDDKKSVYIHQGSEGQQKVFNVTKNSKTMILPKGTYTIEVSSGDKQSLYQRRFGSFSISTVSVNVVSQKKSLSLGTSSFRCASTPDQGQSIIFYPCNPSYAEALDIKRNGALTNIRQSLDPHETPGIHADDERSDSAGSIIKPYHGGYLEALSLSNALFMRERTSTGDVISSEISEVKNFQSIISDTHFATVNDKNNTTFAILDQEKYILWIFKNAQDTNPTRIDLTKEKPTKDGVLVEQLFLSGDFAYVTLTRDSSTLETHDSEGEVDEKLEDEVETANAEQKIIKVDIKKGTVSKVIKLPDDFLVRQISASSSGNILLTPHFSSEIQRITVLRNGTLENIPFLSNDIRNICWEDGENFYYSTGDGNKLYKYSLKDNGSFLIYENPVATIASLSCAFGNLSFTLTSEKDGIIEGYNHFALDNKNRSGNNLESVLPLYIDIATDTVVKVSQNKDSVLVSLLYSPGTLPSKDQIQTMILVKLEEQGIETKDLTIEFAF